ncbi:MULTISPECIES: hypothetical protein [Nocardiopsidaceae]|uniref:Uncharacterized protein n=1 Tax=Streptomonospora nanhaiensis TaxID=1323731 RepID=A0ABY6YX88_9ACTN|nr:hypothetical protein [Streptomonospora nanhaiensis]WAE76837.1 hypothetical protein OUQ99_31505 [Streptomonospora nanhaiensis]
MGHDVIGIFWEAIDRHGGQIPLKYLSKTALKRLAGAGLLDFPEGRRVSERGRAALPVATALMPRP